MITETAIPVTRALLEGWVTQPDGPVALHLKQTLIPIEGHGGVIFPPTYTDIGYNIDKLSDESQVVTIDSVGSQANRLEPLFKEGGPYADLVPQIKIQINDQTTVSLLDLAHRSADAAVHSCPTLKPLVEEAFQSLKCGDAGPLCAVAPTSLVFGVWDSRGSSQEKRPRLVRSIIRAWNVEPLHTAAQFNSIWKSLDDRAKKELEAAAATKDASDLSDVGLADAPSVFRKNAKVQQFLSSGPNPAARVLGGVVARGPIERQITINLLALRGIRGKDDHETRFIHQYLLGLSLLAATADMDLFLREGCHLRHSGHDQWFAIPRRGEPEAVGLAEARDAIKQFAEDSARHFQPVWPQVLVHKFDLSQAKTLLTKDSKKDKKKKQPEGGAESEE